MMSMQALMLKNNFFPCISEATRIANLSKPSLVDNIFINSTEIPISGNILEHVSYDHLPNFCIIENEVIKKVKNIPVNIKLIINYLINLFVMDGMNILKKIILSLTN